MIWWKTWRCRNAALTPRGRTKPCGWSTTQLYSVLPPKKRFEEAIMQHMLECPWATDPRILAMRALVEDMEDGEER